MTKTNATATFTLIQRDGYGDPVNTITGLHEDNAETLAAWLRTGDAYQGDRPWTCEIVRELTPAEETAAVVDSWLANGDSLTRTDHMVACLRRVADQLELLGSTEVPRTGLKVEMHLWSSDGSDEKRMAALDLLAGVFGLEAETNGANHYHTGHSHGGGVRMVTIVDPAPAPKPLVSDETIERCDDCESNGYNCSAHSAQVSV